MAALQLVCVFAFAAVAVHGAKTVADVCAAAEADPKHVDERTAVVCNAFQLVAQAQLALDTVNDQSRDKKKNEFIRFGKRKNEFIRFGKRADVTETAEKRKNEFIRFGKRADALVDEPVDAKRKNEFIRFGKRKNEFIRFGKRGDADDDFALADKKKNEFIRFGKRKNEFIRFG